MKKKLLALIISVIALIVIVSAIIYTEPWNTNQRGGNHNLTEMGWISAGTLNGTNIIGTFTGDVEGDMNWTFLQNYPAACPAYSAITLLNDSVTCTSYQTMANLTVTGNITAENVYLPTYLSTHTNTSITAVEGIWMNVTFDVHEDTLKARITHTYNDATNESFIIQDTGIYRVNYGISFLDTQATPTNYVAIRLVENGTEVEGSVFEKDTTQQNAVGTIYRAVTASLTAGNHLKLQFVSNATTVSIQTRGTYGDHPTSASINIHRI